jgi:hypothetical protein
VDLQVAEIEAQTGLDLEVLFRFSGGEQEGAQLVADSAGRRLVLKFQPDPLKAKRLLEAAPIVDHAVGHGWPGAAWLYAGPLQNGTAFLLQEYVVGKPISLLDSPTMQAIVDANSLQSGLAAAEAVDDSAQLEAVAAGDHPWKAMVSAHSSAGAALVRHGDNVIRRLGSVQLPVSDLVHGDYSSSNMILTREGTVCFIDSETAARGTRARDLADLYRQCFVYPGTSLTVMQMLRDQACAIAGPAVFSKCVVAVSYNNLAWRVENRSSAQFNEACERVRTLFNDLAEYVV